MIAIDIDMPDNCYNCPCFDGEYGTCNITDKDIMMDWALLEPQQRPVDCPLKEIEDDSTISQ